MASNTKLNWADQVDEDAHQDQLDQTAATATNPPNSWAALAKQSLPAFVPHVTKARVVKSEEQKREYDNQQRHREHTSLVRTSLVELRKRFNELDGEYYVFSDEYTWGELKYVGQAASVDQLLDVGQHGDMKWWHGYNPRHDLIIQFKCKKELTCQFRFSPGTAYMEAVKAALANAELP